MSRSRGVSRVTAVGLVIIVLVIVVASYDTLYSAPATLVASIIPEVYAPSPYNYGYLNELANFTTRVMNSSPSNKTISMTLANGGSAIVSKNESVGAGTTNITLSYRLSNTGIWTFRVTSGGSELNSYSFEVVTNRDQAQLAVNQLANQQRQDLYNLIGAVASVIGIASAGFGVYRFLKKRKSKRKPSKESPAV
ncbi:MAG TPA: hypothetical protein VGR53_04655 [Nitrososphaerales archaeon]|nr:hypothetical protein [Nitrososphaerales archaeon]